MKSKSISSPSLPLPSCLPPPLQHFPPTDEAELTKIILTGPSKSCSLHWWFSLFSSLKFCFIVLETTCVMPSRIVTAELMTLCLHPHLNVRGWLFLVNSRSYQKPGDCQPTFYNQILWLVFLKNLGRSKFLLYLAGKKHIVSNQHLDFHDQTYWVGWYRPYMI